MKMRREDWVSRKVDFIERLQASECGGDYAEAILIISGVLSALASEVWPGDRIDQQRFVEAMVTLCDADLHSARISIPLLVADLRDTGRSDEEAALRRQFLQFPPLRLLTGDEADHYDQEVVSICSALERKYVRRFSYASVFYREVRSALVHEYRIPGAVDTNTVMSDPGGNVCYGNWDGDPDRHIYFPISWLASAALSISRTVDNLEQPVDRPIPENWWLDG